MEIGPIWQPIIYQIIRRVRVYVILLISECYRSGKREKKIVKSTILCINYNRQYGIIKIIVKIKLYYSEAK